MQVWARWRWRGVRRLLAAVPAVAVTAHALVIAAVRRDPTSHNLLPLELGVTMTSAFAFLGILALLRRWYGRTRPGAGAA